MKWTTAGDKQRDFVVELSTWTFRLCWMGFLLFHVVCVGFYCLAAYAYHLTPRTNFSWIVPSYNVALPLEDFPKLVLIHLLVGLVHLGFVVILVMASFQTRMLALQPRGGGSTLTSTLAIPFKSLQKSSVGKAIASLSQHPAKNGWEKRSGEGPHAARSITVACWCKCKRLTVRILSLFSISSPHFDSILIIRESIQTGLQSYQAYWMSRLLPRSWLNQFFVVCLVLNCWTTPLIKIAGARLSTPVERLLCVFSDAVLDFVSTVIVPVAVFAPYYEAYIPEIQDFPMENWYKGAWVVNAVYEFQILLVQSWLDLIMRLVFAVNLLNCVQIMKNVVSRPQSGFMQNAIAVAPVGTSATRGQANLHTLATTSKSGRAAGLSWKCNLTIQAIFCLWGCFVLMAHLYATSQVKPDLCVTQIRPWFQSKPGCSTFELDCERAAVAGTANEFDLILSKIDPSGLACLLIRRCPALEVTERVNSFSRLMIIAIKNSTLLRWEEDAAINNLLHPEMRLLSMIDVKMAELPLGVQSRQFPLWLRDINIVASNLTHLPADLHESWSNVLYLYLEWLSFQEFPSTLLRIPLEELSLVGNRIQELPLEVITSWPSVSQLFFSGNPIELLPDGVSAAPSSSMTQIRMDSTPLRSLPSWFDEFATVNLGVLGAARTPLCQRIANDSLFVSRAYQSHIDCEYTESISYIPTELVPHTELEV